jgi:hypothetical protein
MVSTLRLVAASTLGPNAFLDEAIQAKADGQRQRNPRELAIGIREYSHRDEADGHGRPLQRTQLFLQHQDAQQDGDQGVDEVAQRGLHGLARSHRVGVGQPVNGDQKGGHGQRAEHGAIPQSPPQGGPRAGHRDEERAEQQRPHHPVGHDFDGARRHQHKEVQREQPPQPVSADAKEDSRRRLLVHSLGRRPFGASCRTWRHRLRGHCRSWRGRSGNTGGGEGSIGRGHDIHNITSGAGIPANSQ